MIKLAPSILSADFANLEKDITAVSNAGAHYLHIDVMDGMFVPNITIGPPVIRSLRKKSDMVFDVHLMIENPQRYIQLFFEAGADIINVHAEACENLTDTVNFIKSLGVKAGVTIKPDTNIDVIFSVLEMVDLILVMSVEPGFGGQKLVPHTLSKIRKLREIIDAKGLPSELEIDGGVNFENIEEVILSGANVIVAGSSVFNEDGAQANVKQFLEVFKNF